MQRPSSRARSRSTSRDEGAYHPPTDTAPDAFDYCNAFWVDPQKSREGGRRAEGDAEEKDWGKEGYETVMGRVKASAKVCEDLRALLKERASAAEDYAKRLNKLSRHSFGVGETGHMERAMLQVKSELEASAKSHTDLATLMRHQEAMVGDFVQKREAARKLQQSNVEKLWKNLLNTRQHVLKAKAKYQDDAIQINALHAQAALLQGRDLDKATLKLDKAQQTVVVNERDYRNYANVLKETTVNWNMAWKSFCDLVQDQEEERLEFLKSRMWDYANGLSTLAMAEDESAERTRTALEQCDPKIDIRIFVQQFGTGNAIPDPIPFVDASAKTAPPKQGYRSAAFTRSSTRIPGVTHSPSAIDDIARAMHHLPASQQPQRQQPQPSSQMPRSSTQPELESQSRPASRAANRMSQPNLSTQQAPAAAAPPALASPARPGQSPQDHGAAQSRFAVSPSANLRQRPSSEHVPVATPPTSKPGHISAAAFQGRQSAVSPSLGASINGASTAPVDAGSSPSPARYEASAPGERKGANAAAVEEDENDPLLQALKHLQTTPVHAPARSQRSSVDLRASAASPSQRAPSRGHHHQPSFGSATGAPPNGMMQAPPAQAQQTRPRSPSVPYAQPDQPRPSSRAGSNVSSAAGAHPHRQSTGPHLASPAPAGQFSARPVSPAHGQRYSARPTSPQPHIPDSLRPRSPAMGNPPSVTSPVASVQSPARPLSAFGTPLSQGGYASPQQQAPPPQQQFAAPPLQQPATYAQPPPHAAYGGYRATSPAPRPPSVVSPASGYAPPPQQRQPHMAQAPSQQFQQYAQAPPPQPVYAPPPQQIASPPNSYGYPAQQQYAPAPQQQQQPLQHPQQYGRPPSVVGGYASPASAAQQAALARTPSTHSGVSGVSGVSIQQTPLQAYQQTPSQQPQPQAHPQQQQHARGTSVASMRAGQTPPPPPTGQYTDSGQPILFYVNALFDYQAASAEEFSFSTGDVIAVTGTDPDGWWSGKRVGDQGPSKLFPSNFTELLP